MERSEIFPREVTDFDRRLLSIIGNAPSYNRSRGERPRLNAPGGP